MLYGTVNVLIFITFMASRVAVCASAPEQYVKTIIHTQYTIHTLAVTWYSFEGILVKAGGERPPHTPLNDFAP